MAQTEVSRSSLRPVLAATIAGTAMEWYDFYLYATASALVFARVFFPALDPVVGTIASFGSFAAGFFIRPLGGIFFGHLGDKIGRKNVLVTTLLLMGVATTLIGIVPGYATIGLWAPLLLVILRLLQGFGAGAEYAGAVILAAEHSPTAKRGLYSAVPYCGVSIGLLAGRLVPPPAMRDHRGLRAIRTRAAFRRRPGRTRGRAGRHAQGVNRG